VRVCGTLYPVTTPGDPASNLRAPVIAANADIPRGGQADDADRPTTTGPELSEALSNLRELLRATTYPLDLPSAERARRTGAALVGQLDDYLLPRLARLDAPLLVVVGGSTGAGKSTLVNSLVRARVSAAGVLRPTTRAPVLVCSPADSAWFRRGELLPRLTRTAGPGNRPDTLQLITAPGLPPGLAFLDAPDIDSVVESNRALATQLLSAADLWLFVTTAARYADAVPWELLRTAQRRGTVIALVLNRVPPRAADEITPHLAEMLAARDLGGTPVFVLPETTVDGQGLLPETTTAALRTWFGQLARDPVTRSAVVRQTLGGALTALGPALEELALAADEQSTTVEDLDERVAAAYRVARQKVTDGLRDGRLLRGEVLDRWQEFVGTGEFFRSLEARIGRLRDRMMAVLAGRPAPEAALGTALESQLATLLEGVATEATEAAYAAWRIHPAGEALLDPTLARPGSNLPARAERLVRTWQRGVLELVREQGGDKRAAARGAAYAVNAAGLAAMVTVFATTAFIPTGLEVAAAGGTTLGAQKVLEAIFGDRAVRTLAARAQEDLLNLVDTLLAEESARFTARLATASAGGRTGAELRRAGAAVAAALQRTTLDPGIQPPRALTSGATS
jgi:hypothetical protein